MPRQASNRCFQKSRSAEMCCHAKKDNLSNPSNPPNPYNPLNLDA
jgi:hypothetical protein